jgi:signal transduction histidine kinase
LLGLINEILDLSKIESGRLEICAAPKHLPELLRDLLATARPLAEANHNKLKLSVHEDLPPLMIDEGRVRQCLFNLISNGCKFTRNGTIEVSASFANQVVTIACSDTGIGIDEEFMERLFEPFEQANNASNMAPTGTGLGLAITRRLARAMGGDVSVQSSPGKGSVFTLTFHAMPVEETDRQAA